MSLNSKLVTMLHFCNELCLTVYDYYICRAVLHVGNKSEIKSLKHQLTYMNQFSTELGTHKYHFTIDVLYSPMIFFI